MNGMHLNNFTLLRLIAALFVVVSHSYFLTGNEVSEPLYATSQGKIILSDIGLYIFFFTSGYLVTSSLFYASSLRQFVYKRILRIYPALIVAVLITVFIIGPIVTIVSFTDYIFTKQTWLYLITITGFKIEFLLPGVFNNPSFFSNGVNGSLWSIALELKLYCLLLLISICSNKNNRVLFSIITSVIILLCLFGIVYNVSFTTPFIDHKILKVIACFFIGSCFKTIAFKRYFVKIGLIILLLVMLTSNIFQVSFSKGIVEIFIVCLSTYLFATTKRLVLPLQTDISYGIYIYAFPVQQALFQYSNFTMGVAWHFIATLAITILIAFISWKFIEQPALALKSKIS
jgi:peptidoglycan/LPS O-acetylase OafA/YrhL